MKRNLLLFFSLFVVFLAAAQVPTITSFSPLGASFNSSVTITGTNFSPVAANNYVMFGNVRAEVLGANATTLNVRVPESATFDYISVSVSGKTVYSQKKFTPTFACGAGTLDTTSFVRPASKYFAKNAATCQGSVVGDIDGDGKQDLIIGMYNDSNLAVYRNIGEPGTLDSNSFQKIFVKLPFKNVFQVGMGDLNADGKPEIIAGCFSRDTFIVLQNNSTPGNINLTTGATGGFVAGSSACAIKVADMDADGIADIIIANRNKRFSIFKNSNTGGALSSANFTRTDFLVGTTAAINDVAVGDLNMDGLPDVVIPDYNATTMHVYINNGALSFTDNPIATTYNGTWGIALADFDGDGKMDIGGSNRNNNNVFIYPNTTTGTTFSVGTSVNYATTGVQFIYCSAADLNGDAKPDLLFANLATNGNAYIFQNTSTVGSISFGTGFHLKQNTGAINISVSDIDQDGFPDIFFPDNSTGGYSFRNANGTRIKVYNIDTAAGVSSVNLRYTSLGVPAIEYTINYNAETQGDGFVPVPWTAITSSPIVVPVPSGITGGPYYGTIQVRNATCTAEVVTFSMNFETTNITPQFVYGNSHALNICKGSPAVSLDSILTVADTDSAQMLTWSVGQAALHGTLVVADSVASGDTTTHSGFSYTPDINYVGNDTFTVHISDGQATSTATMVVSVNSVTPGFSVDMASQCFIGNSFSLTDTSTTTSGTLTRNWSLGDGNSSSSAALSKTYASAGSYDVKLIATNTIGCMDSVTHTVIVNPNPEAGFSMNSNGQCINGNNFAFTDTSVVSAGTLTRVWNFGNGDTASSVAPNLTYASANEYDVKLVSITNEGCTDTVTHTIEVFAKPSAGFTVNSTSQCANANNFTFNDTSIVAGGTLSRAWDFDNGNTASSISPSISYTNADSYTVKLVSISDHGCKDSTTQIVYVRPVPTVGFTVNDDSQCENNNSFTFTDTTSVVSGSYTRTWKFSGTDSTSSATPVRTFTGAGSKNIKLVAESNYGCRDSVTKTITLDAKPTATTTAQSATTFCNGGSVAIDANTGTGLTYQWLNNGTVIGSQTASSYTATTAGNYKVVVTNSNSCRDTSTAVSVTVNALPSTYSVTGGGAYCATGAGVSIGLSNSQSGINYQLYNGTSAVGSPMAGSGSSITFSNVTAAGTYTIKATNATTLCGPVTMTGSATVTINPLPTAYSVTGGGSYCAGGTGVTIGLSNSETGVSYQLYNGTSAVGGVVTGSGASIGFGNFTAAGNYTVKATNATTLCGPVTMTGSADVIINPLPAAYNVTGGGAYCAGGTGVVIGLDNSQSGVNYQLYTGTTAVGTPVAGNGSAISFGNQAAAGTYTVKATNGTTSCGPVIMTGSATVTINPIPDVVAPLAQTVCNGTATTLVSFSGAVSGTTFAWTNNHTSIGLAASGSGTIAAFTATNTTSIPVISTITVTPSASGCTGSSQSFTITVNPTANVNTVSNQTLCNGVSTSAVTFGGSVSGTTYAWTNNTPSIGLAASGSGDIASFASTNTTNAPVIATITVTPTANGCTGTAKTFTITVNPTPNVNAVSNQTLCNGAATNAVNFGGNVSNTSYNWINNLASVGIAASGSGNIASFTAANATTSPVAATITVTPSANSCTGSSTSFDITVNPTPDVNAVSNQTLCNGSSTSAVTFGGSVSGTTYAWTNNTPSIGLAASGSGDIASFAATNTSNAPVTATITVTPTANGCTGAASTFTITVNPTPTVNAVSNQTLCNNTATTAVTFTGNVSNTSYSWTNSLASVGIAANGLGDIVSFAATNATASPVAATITVTPSANNCTGSSTSFDINVNPTPDVNTVSNQTICNGVSTSAVTFGGNVSGTTFAWTNDLTSVGLAASGSGDIASFTATNTSYAITTATVTVTPTANTCVGTAGTFTITVNPTPDVASVSNQTVCNGAAVSAVSFSGNVNNTSYSWTNDLASIGLAANGNGDIASFNGANTSNAPVTANIIVIPTANTCAGPQQSFSIIVNPTPDVNAVSNQALCHGSATAAVSFSGSVSGTSYSWTNDLASIGLAASGTGDIASFNATNTTNAPVTATIMVTPSANSCSGSSKTYSITVNPIPDVVVPSNQIICNGASTSMLSFGSAVSGATYSWTNNKTSIGLAASGNGDITSFSATNTGTDPVVATITVTPTANGCTGSAQTFTITVNPTPALSSTATPAAICNKTVFHYTPASLTAGTTFAWSRAAVAGISNTAANGTDDPGEQLENTTAQPVTVTYSYTLTANGCSNTQQVEVVVNPSPELSSASTTTICSGALFNYTPASATTVSSYAWSRAAVTGITPATGSGTGNITETLLNSTLSPIDVTYAYTLTAFGCTNAQTITLTVDPSPAAPSITLKSAASLCANTQYVNFGAAVPQPSGVNYTWSAANATVFATGADKQYAIISFPTAGTSIVTLTANVPGFGCTSKDSFVIEVGTGVSHTTTVRYFNKHFVCMENTVTSYQWGYDDATTLAPTVFAGEINQNYLNPTPDLTGKLYWVQTEKNGCMQKTYYKTPTGLNQASASDSEIKAYPNPANDMIQVEISGLHGGEASVEVIDMLGKSYGTYATTGGKAQLEVSGLKAGVYFLSCTQNGVKMGVKRFVKN